MSDTSASPAKTASTEAGPSSAPLAPSPHERARRLRRWLRVAIFCTVLGAALTCISGWRLAHEVGGVADAISGEGFYHLIEVPLFSLLAIAGALLLERLPAVGMAALLTGTELALSGGGIYLLPGALLGCCWAANINRRARAALGALLLVPGIAGGFYGLMAAISYTSGMALSFMPATLSPPAQWSDVLMPFALFPCAFVGAWLLVAPWRSTDPVPAFPRTRA